MKKILISTGSFLTLIMPMLVLAEAQVRTGYIDSLIRSSLGIVRSLLIFLISLAVVWFIWNTIQYTISDDEDKKSKAKDQMVWGIIGIAVIVSVWGLVAILRNMFGVDNSGGIPTNLGGMIPPAI